ncbi:MAG TPA: hypothetical protein VIW70_17365 [Rubrivivax sp.]
MLLHLLGLLGDLIKILESISVNVGNEKFIVETFINWTRTSASDTG